MNAKEFDLIVRNQQDEIRNVLGQKANEYAFGDRLSNFKRAGAMLKTTPEQALIGMWTKHVISILDMVDTLEEKDFSQATWDEKIGDAINYLILLKGLIHERIGKDVSRASYPCTERCDSSSIFEPVPVEVGPVLPQPLPNRSIPRQVPEQENRSGNNEIEPDFGDRIQWPR